MNNRNFKSYKYTNFSGDCRRIFFKNIFALSKKDTIFAIPNHGAVAQMVEQWTENPCVGSSILPSTTCNPLIISGFFVTDTVSDTVCDGFCYTLGYTLIAILPHCKGDFKVTSLHFTPSQLELCGIELHRVGNRVGLGQKQSQTFPKAFPAGCQKAAFTCVGFDF